MISKYLKHSFSNFTVRSLTSSTILYSKLLHTFRFRYTRLQIHFLSTGLHQPIKQAKITFWCYFSMRMKKLVLKYQSYWEAQSIYGIQMLIIWIYLTGQSWKKNLKAAFLVIVMGLIMKSWAQLWRVSSSPTGGFHVAKRSVNVRPFVRLCLTQVDQLYQFVNNFTLLPVAGDRTVNL